MPRMADLRIDFVEDSDVTVELETSVQQDCFTLEALGGAMLPEHSWKTSAVPDLLWNASPAILS